MNYKDPQNPLKWVGSGQQLTDLYLQVKINGDVALLKIILKLMKEKEDAEPKAEACFIDPSTGQKQCD